MKDTGRQSTTSVCKTALLPSLSRIWNRSSSFPDTSHLGSSEEGKRVANVVASGRFAKANPGCFDVSSVGHVVCEDSRVQDSLVVAESQFKSDFFLVSVSHGSGAVARVEGLLAGSGVLSFRHLHAK
jgi:hypothetical protein